MKKGLHPQYNDNIQVSCACGNSFKSGSTKDEIRVEICSNCHPFYTGKQKLIDTTGRVDRFKKQVTRATEIGATKVIKKPRKTQAEKTAK